MQAIRPSKRLGQNFLVDKNVIKKVIRAANLQPNDVVLEIGPGLGALTKELAKLPVQVLAVEKDKRLCQILGAKLKDFENVEIIQGDILKLKPDPKPEVKLGQPRVLKSGFKIVANLPFYITAPVIRKFLESPHPPKEMILIIQKEVAQRICAKPPRMNLLAISVQFYAIPKIISYVSKKSFKPKPKVDAAIIKITPCAKPSFAQKERFFRIVKAGFSHPRKQLVNNLLALSAANGLKLNKKELSSLLMACGIKPSQRAETLTIDDWIKLTKVLK